MTDTDRFIDKAALTYLHQTHRKTTLLAELAEMVKAQRWPAMHISALQAEYLTLLVKSLQPSAILEIGTYVGYGTLALARGLIGPGIIHTCDITDRWLAVAQLFWQKAGFMDKIKFYCTDGLSCCAAFQNQSMQFDLIFIDADKKRYFEYYLMGLSLLKPHGVLLFDNTLWRGQVWSQDNTEGTAAVIKRFNQSLQKDNRIDYCLLPIGDGLTMILKR